MIARLNRSKESFRCDSLAFYEVKMVDPNASIGEQLKARQMIDDLLGLRAPNRDEISGMNGGPIMVQHARVVIELPDNGRDPKQEE